MRILIISYCFAPQNAIGAVRPTKLAKYFERMGHEVTVICGSGLSAASDPTLARDLAAMRDVRVLAEWNPLRAHKARKSAAAGEGRPSAPAAKAGAAGEASVARRAVHGAADVAYRFLRECADSSFRRLAVKELGRLAGPYDAVFSTYAPLSVHEAAREAKRRGLAKVWIADFRDEVDMMFHCQEGRRRRYLRMVRGEVDGISAVSRGFLEMMGFENGGRVVSNGYDREDLPSGAERRPDGTLRVAYCGTLLEGRHALGARDITPMFRALRALVDEGELSLRELRLVYAGAEGALFRQYAASCGLEECVEEHGAVSREASIALQRGADVLLMASWHTAAQRGILTGKLFEYLMMDKPVVCCMQGDLPNSGVKQVLRETGMGLCCEQAGGAAEEAALLAWLRALARRWRGGEALLEGRNQAAVERYAYPALAAELTAWMEELLARRG